MGRAKQEEEEAITEEEVGWHRKSAECKTRRRRSDYGRGSGAAPDVGECKTRRRDHRRGIGAAPEVGEDNTRRRDHGRGSEVAPDEMGGQNRWFKAGDGPFC